MTSPDSPDPKPRDYDRGLRFLSRVAGTVLATFVFAFIVFLLLFQWNWLRGPIGRMASARLHREVRLVGDLDVALLRADPEARIADLQIADAPWRNAREPMIRVQHLTVATRWTDLFAGRVSFPYIRVERGAVNLVRSGDRANWRFSDEPDDGSAPDIPPISNLTIADSRLSFHDTGRNMSLDATVNSTERVSAGGQGQFRLSGTGRIRTDPFQLLLTGGPLINIDRSRPYPLTADIRAGSTRLTARGQIDRPFDLGHFRAALTLEGQDLRDVYDITGLALPNSPPYRLSGMLVRDDRLYIVSGMSGRVGDSDLEGSLRIRLGGVRPNVTANLRSHRLDFDDLLAVMGAPPASQGGTMNAAQVAQAAHQRAERRLLPDATLDTARFRAVDADVTYQADTVNAQPGLPLRSVSAHASLDNALLVVDRVAFGFPQGQITGNARLNARGSVPRTDIDLRVRGIRVEGLVPAFQGAPPIEGPIQARIVLHGSGNSIRAAAGSSDGQITAVIPNGRVRRSLAELSSVNVLPGLLQLLSHDQSEARLSCAVANFTVRNGVGTATTLAADTEVVVIHGRGTINLGDETFNLHIDGDSKRPRILRVFAPFDVNGRWLAPQFHVETTPVIVQSGIAVVLGALINPLAALIPFLEPGGADDLNCPALEARAAAQGAPTAAAPVRRPSRRR